MAATEKFLGKLVRTWPALPYMALGAWLASVYIANSGTAWLSDSEMDGGNLSSLFIYAALAAGAAMLLATFAVPKVLLWVTRPATAVGAGALAALGNALIIAIGPYYLTPVLPHVVIMGCFICGGVLFGVGIGALALRCGQLYGALPPRQVILYAAFSQLVVALSFFIVVGSPAWAPVPGGPSLVGILSFVGMPLLAGVLAALSRYSDRQADPADYAPSRSALPRSFWKLLAVVFVFSCIVSSVYASVVYASPVDTTLNGSRLVMLLRMVLALALVAVAVLFLWCTLAFIVYQRRISPVIVFGYGFGAYLLATGIGWLFGVRVVGSLFQAVGEPFAYMIMALVVLACAFIIFSEREFDRLFAPEEEGAPTLDDLLKQDLAVEGADGAAGEPVHKGRFGAAIEELSERYQLSPRETDVLRCLAMGYNSSTTASKLHISWNTVRTHTRNIYGKLGVHSHQELIGVVDEATAGE